MKIIFLIMVGFTTLLPINGWCQAPPSGPGETLKHSQNTMEYYELQHTLQKGKDRLSEKKDDSKENAGDPKEIEINEGEDHVIRYFDDQGTEID